MSKDEENINQRLLDTSNEQRPHNINAASTHTDISSISSVQNSGLIVQSIDTSLNNLKEVSESDAKPKLFTSFNIDEELTAKNLPRKIFDLAIFSMQNLVYNSSLFIIYIMNMYFVSRENSPELIAGYGLASTVIAAFGFAVIFAFNYGMQAQGAQAFGAKQYQLVGLICQRGLLVNLAYAVLVSPVFLFLKTILGWISIETIDATETYSRWMIFPIFIIIIQRSFRIYLSIHKEYMIPTYCGVIAQIIHPLWLYIFCSIYNMSVKGIALATAVTELITLFFSFAISTYKKKYQSTWFGFERKAFTGWFAYTKYAFSVGASSYIEWFSFEIQTIIIGLLNDDDQMAAHSAQASLIMFYYMIPLSLNQTIGTYLGNAAGAGNVRLAKNIIKLTFYCLVFLTAIMVVVGWLIQPYFADLLCTGERMTHYFIEINNIYIFFFMISDYCQGVFQGIMRSIGLENKANVVFFFSFFIFGNTLSGILVHADNLGAPGAWWANGIAAYVASIALLIVLKKSNITKSIQETARRVLLESQEVKSSEDFIVVDDELNDSKKLISKESS